MWSGVRLNNQVLLKKNKNKTEVLFNTFFGINVSKPLLEQAQTKIDTCFTPYKTHSQQQREAMETYTLISTDKKYGFEEFLSLTKEYNGKTLYLENVCGLKIITIKVEMTPGDRKALEEQGEITMKDLKNFGYEIDEVCEEECEWAIRGEIADEERDQIMEELAEHNYDTEELGWTIDGGCMDYEYELVDGKLEFMDD